MNEDIPKPKIAPLTASSAIGLPSSPMSASGRVVIPGPVYLAPGEPPIPMSGEPELVAEQEMEYAAPHYEVAPPRRSNFIVEYWRKVGGGSLTISLLIHGGIIALAIAWVSTQVIYPKVDFLPGGGTKGAAEASAQQVQQVQQKKRSAMAKTAPMRKVVSQSTDATISLPDVPVDNIEVPDVSSLMGGAVGSSGFGTAGSGGGFGKGNGIGGQMGFTTLPPTLKARCNSAERLAKLKETGGTPECEKAVSTALEYFKTKQNADGSWGTQFRGAMTGFTLLCYLGRCETPDSPIYGDNVLKAIMYLIELGKKNEGMMADNMDSNGAVYEHGIATYALGEMYTLARLGSKSLPGMREAFEAGVKIVIKGQQPGGGWGYKGRGQGTGYRTEGRGDPSVTGWQYQALKAAKLSGLKIDGLHTAIANAVKYLESIQNKEGGFGGTNREVGAYQQWTMTPVGVLGLQTLATGKSDKIKKGIRWAHEFHQQEPPTWQTANLYSWYYYAQAYFQFGGAEWKYWNDTALPEILKNQSPNGSWRGKGGQGGNGIYETALCTLMLEVYYRYLKVGDREQGSIFDKN